MAIILDTIYNVITPIFLIIGLGIWYGRASELAPENDDLAFFAEEARRLAGPDAVAPLAPTDPEDAP